MSRHSVARTHQTDEYVSRALTLPDASCQEGQSPLNPKVQGFASLREHHQGFGDSVDV
jgi:hypothetical protein